MEPPDFTRNSHLFALILIVVLTCITAYYPGLSGDFIFDDVVNISQNKRIHIEKFDTRTLTQIYHAGAEAGLLKRPVSMFSFALNYYLHGLNPYYFKLTSLIIHIGCGLSLFLLCQLLLSIHRRYHNTQLSQQHVVLLSVGIAAAWMLHPVNLSGALYIVQRMTSLSALFTVWAVITYVWGRLLLDDGKITPAVTNFTVMFLFAIMGVLSKENGLLVFGFIFLIEWCFFRRQNLTTNRKRAIIGLHLVTFVAPVVTVIFYTLSHPAWLFAGYDMRPFSLTERIMTEARILWQYIHWIVLPDIGKLGLYHDDISVSKSLFNPITTVVSCIGLTSLFLGAIVVRKNSPILSFGILFFLMGHALESTIYPLELAHEHRNYLPSFSLILCLFYFLTHAGKCAKTLKWRRSASVLIIGLLATLTFFRAEIWGHPLKFSIAQVQNHPMSSSAHHELGIMYHKMSHMDGISNKTEFVRRAIFHFEKSARLNEESVTGLSGLLIASQNPETGWLNEFSNRLENTPFQANHSTALHNFVVCTIRNICKASTDQITFIIRSALQNPKITNTGKANVYITWANYIANVTKDFSSATEKAKLAVHTDPANLQYRLELAKFYLVGNNLEKATAEINVVKKRDKKYLFSDSVMGLEQLIASSVISHKNGQTK